MVERSGRRETEPGLAVEVGLRASDAGAANGAAAARTAGCGAARGARAALPDAQALKDGPAADIGQHAAPFSAEAAWPQAIAHRIASESCAATVSRRPASSETAARTKAAIGRCIARILAWACAPLGALTNSEDFRPDPSGAAVPEDVGDAPALVLVAGHDEERVGEAVQVP